MKNVLLERRSAATITRYIASACLLIAATACGSDADAAGDQSARFMVETDEILQPGGIGTFPVETASFWYRRMGLPSQMTFEGTGTLEVTRHVAQRGARRMEGRLIASGLEDSRGDRVDVEAEFAVGLSCGVESS